MTNDEYSRLGGIIESASFRREVRSFFSVFVSASFAALARKLCNSAAAAAVKVGARARARLCAG